MPTKTKVSVVSNVVLLFTLFFCLTASFTVSASSSSPQLVTPPVDGQLEVQVARDSQKLDDMVAAIDELKGSKYLERLGILEETVKDIHDSIKEATWVLRGLIVAVLGELFKRILGKFKVTEPEQG